MWLFRKQFAIILGVSASLIVLGGQDVMGSPSRSRDSDASHKARAVSAAKSAPALSAASKNGRVKIKKNSPCPPNMAFVEGFCVDRYEASLREMLPSGQERSWSPYETVEGHTVRAVSEAGVVPQAYISGEQAAQACAHSGKRLCKPNEWKKACMGPKHRTYGYGDTNEPGRCNDHGRSPVVALLGVGSDNSEQHKWNWHRMNQPALNQLKGTLAKTGEHDKCTNGYDVYDMVGNLHEWVADKSGRFQGGYYLDTHENGDGCTYATTAHNKSYHDYSTGFRCCADSE